MENQTYCLSTVNHTTSQYKTLFQKVIKIKLSKTSVNECTGLHCILTNLPAT